MENKKAVILACGSFNPPTFGHLRMLEDAKITLESSGFKVLEGILSPVSDGYGKATLISANHRLAMAVAATLESDWLRADGWECSNSEWKKTVDVIKYHKEESKKRFGNGITVFLLVGGDVVETFDKLNADGTPVWSHDDVEEIVSSGLVVQPRPGSNPEKTLEVMDLDIEWANVHIIKDAIASTSVSSTKLRQAIKERHSIKYLTPDSVISYIEKNNLYR